MPSLLKKSNPATTAVNNAGSGHGEMVGDDPFLNDLLKAPHYSAENEAGTILKYLRSLGWKRPPRSGSSMLDRQSPNGQDEVWVDWDQWRHMSRASGQWEELGKGMTLAELKGHLTSRKLAREVMHDDSGATTGLRGRPDYGESDSYTMEMNEKNSKTGSANDEAEKFWSNPNEFSLPAAEEESKGIMAGYHITVETPKVASGVEMYISSVEFDPKNATQVEKFAFTADQTKAATFHRLTADEVVHQLGGPDFGVWAKTVLAVDYSPMFKVLETIEPKARPLYRREIEWARQHLKKQDRIVWYLRWYRIALAEDLIKTLPAKVQKPVEASAEVKIADTLPLQPQQQQPPPQIQPQQPQRVPKPKTKKKQLQELVAQYRKDFAAKGGDATFKIVISDFPTIKRNLEHFYSLPVPDIQNKVLTVENYNDIYNAFSVAEQEWKEQAKALIKPKPEDKIWKQFSDGWAWWWLPRPYCEDESRAMGHCGNSPMKDRANVSILSLREPKQVGKETLWYPHCTFILHGKGDSGSIGEMKGRNNDKPVA